MLLYYGQLPVALVAGSLVLALPPHIVVPVLLSCGLGCKVLDAALLVLLLRGLGCHIIESALLVVLLVGPFLGVLAKP